jgi:hypothetical protein
MGYGAEIVRKGRSHGMSHDPGTVKAINDLLAFGCVCDLPAGNVHDGSFIRSGIFVAFGKTSSNFICPETRHLVGVHVFVRNGEHARNVLA